jgi:hypothetical protein
MRIPRNSGSRPDPVASVAAKRPWIVVVALVLTLSIGVIIYFYGDELVLLAQSLLSGRVMHVQGHIRY